MSLEPYDFSRDAAQDLIRRCYDAADKNINPNSQAELLAEIELVAEFLENPKNTYPNEQIKEISDTILNEIDNHKVGEHHLFAEWIAKSDKAYNPLHHLFQAVAEVNGQPKALRVKSFDSSGALITLQYIDETAGYGRNQQHLLEQSRLQEKMHQAANNSQELRYQHLDVFGAKHKNNVMQDDLVETLKLQGIRVPKSHGIDTDQVLKFLKTLAPQIFPAWEKLGVLYSTSNKKEDFLKNVEVLEFLASIDQGIQAAFEKAGDEEAIKLLGLSEETLTWLSEVNQRKDFLMTRSSGAEDSRKNANAGGNISVAYVKPAISDYLKSLGEVVRSYFSESSLKNRLNADLNPFEEPLKLAVTVQELIGEPPGGSANPLDIPVSLVLFTNEPLYVGKEEFRVMRISATYGHGEGVVGNQGIATDTVLILQSVDHPDKLYVHYDNQHKPERLGPVRNEKTGKVELQKIQNPKEMARQPALNENLIGRLYQWGVLSEKFFQDFQDMEIVIKDNTLHPVQSRPIIRPEQLPTYLDLKKIKDLPQSPLTETITTDMIVPGKASVVEITTAEEILLAETLEKAESLFEKGKHKLVVVREPEGANTHPVVNFSSMGVPCLNARGKNYDKVQALVKKVDGDQHLAVCMQAGTISLLDTKIGSIEEYTSKGFVVHPAKIAISLPVEGKVLRKGGVNPEIPQEIKDFLLEIRTASTSKIAQARLNALKIHGWLESYSQRIADLKAKKKEHPLLKKNIKPILAAARSVEAKVNEAFTNVEQALNQQSPGRMEFLFNVKILETVLFQEYSEEAIGRYSVLNMQESFEAADAIIDYQRHLPHQAHFADILMDGTQAISDEVYEKWKRFLFKVEPVAEAAMQGKTSAITPEDVEVFIATLDILRKADALPFFMTFLLEEHINGQDAAAAIKSINKLIPTSEKPLIGQLFESQKQIQQLRSDITSFGDPKLFPDAFNQLQEIIKPFLVSEDSWLHNDQWKGSSQIVRSIALQTMNDLVDLYDSAIKSMKSSQEIKNERERTRKFKEMLGPYFKLLRGWAEKTVKRGFEMHPGWSLYDYLEKIESTYRELSGADPGQLRPSPNFSVSAAMLGSCTDFSRHLPETLEDVFTLIHQNLLGTTSTLLKELLPPAGIKKSSLPEILKAAIETSQKIKGVEVGIPQQIGMDIGKAGITFHFNVPLRNHSGKFSIHYDKQSEKLTMEAQFLGLARQRWGTGAYRATVLDVAGMLPLQAPPKLTSQELSFKWDISNTEHLNYACKEYGKQAEMSMPLNPEWKDIKNFVKDVESDGDLLNAAFVSHFDIEFLGGRSIEFGLILDLFFKKIITAPVNSTNAILNSENFFRLVLNTKNPIHKDLASALVARMDSDNVEKILENIPSEHRFIIEQLLKHFKSPSKLIGSLTTFPIEVWEPLLRQGKCFPEAKATIWSEINSTGISYASTLLLLKLFELDRQQEFTCEVINFLIEHGNNLRAATISHNTVQKNIYDIKQLLLKKIPVIPEVIAWANQLIHKKLYDDKVYGLSLFDKLSDISDVKEIEGIITAATIGITSKKISIVEIAVRLWRKMLLQGFGATEAIAIATEGIKQLNHSRRDASLLLWDELISKGYQISEAWDIAKTGIDSPDKPTSNYCMNLMASLVKAGEKIPEILLIAVEKTKQFDVNYFKGDENWIEKRSLKGLWKELLEKGQGIQEASDLVNLFFESDENSKEDFSFELLELLADLPDVPQEISGNIAHYVDKMYKNISEDAAIRVWRNFLAKGIGIDEAIQYATILMNDKQLSPYLQLHYSCRLWEIIVDTGQGIPEAIDIAAKGMKDSSPSIQDYALKLWVKLKPFLKSSPKMQAALKDVLERGESSYKLSQLKSIMEQDNV